MAVGERRVSGVRFLGLKDENLEGLWCLGFGVEPGESLGSVGMSVGSAKTGRAKELSGSVVVRGEISPERGPARLLFMEVSDFFRPREILLFVGGVLLCTTDENLSFFVVAGLGSSSDLVLPRNLGRVDFDLVDWFGGSVLFFGMKLKDGLGIAKGNCLGFFFGDNATGVLMLGFK